MTMTKKKITEKRLRQIDEVLFDGMTDNRWPDHPEKVDAVLRSLSVHELHELYQSRSLTFGERLANAAIRESHEIVRPRDWDGAMILVQLEASNDDDVDVLWLRDLLKVTQKELDRRATGNAA
jgi:hypothetical protein